LVFCAMASLLVGYMTTAMRPPRALAQNPRRQP
jgi:hypothetical protein